MPQVVHGRLERLRAVQANARYEAGPGVIMLGAPHPQPYPGAKACDGIVNPNECFLNDAVVLVGQQQPDRFEQLLGAAELNVERATRNACRLDEIIDDGMGAFTREHRKRAADDLLFSLGATPASNNRAVVNSWNLFGAFRVLGFSHSDDLGRFTLMRASRAAVDFGIGY